MLRVLPVTFLTLAASPALAGATPWQDIAPGARARLISSDTIHNGTTMIGLEVDLGQSEYTYWRIPGETGIPTQLDFSGSTGVSDPQMHWPYPEIDRSKGFLDYIYRGALVLPIALATSGGDARVSAVVTLGVCSDVCIPAQAQFTLPLSFGTPDSAQTIRLTQAEAEVPIPWDGPGEPFGAATATIDGFTLADPAAAIDPASLIADIGDPAVLFQTPQKSPDGTLWTVKLLGGAEGKRLDGRAVQLTFMTSMGPYAVSRQIAARH